MHGGAEDLDLFMEDAEGASIRKVDWGGMSVNLNRLPPGTDMGPVLTQLPSGGCSVPHWGYIVEGSLTVTYQNGESETISEGQVFYMPGGHSGLVSESGFVMAEFSPSEEMAQTWAEIGKVLEADD